ncbi:MAG: T9SS type A sorting domain-containing protein [Chitinophagaceae bacterium]|nr:MAG: T9SS type A sorting domain-containing protein [Chitinophagaceae bacterium]
MKLNLPVSGRRLLLVFTSAFIVIVTRAQDLPGAAANLQTAPAGTLVIAMDNTNQACSVKDPGSNSYLFNLKAYGLSVLLLNAQHRLQWVIKAGKAKDAVDFTATAERITPTYVAPQSLDFMAGPILIFPVDTLGISSSIDWFNSNLPDSCKVKVYRLQNATSVDVRYTLARPPRAALLHDTCDIHRNFMEMASVPTINYDCVPNAATLRSGCYTIATEPHITANELTSYDADSIYNFVMSGYNFLAECEGVQTFENLKLFQSTTGVIVDPSGGQYANFNNNVYYNNADMAYGQYQGTFRPWTRGAQKVWRYGSANTNNFYPVTSCKRDAADNLYYVATVSKMTADTGSLVFYLGNHEYYTNDCHTCVSGNTINEDEINGIRLYLNAVLIPTKVMHCLPLPVVLKEFTANKLREETVLVKWSSLDEEDHAFYIVEHSTDGKNFTSAVRVPRHGDSEEGFQYEFLHTTPQSGINYYRLKIVTVSGKPTYTDVRKVIIGSKNQIFNIYPNPAAGKTILMLDVKDGERLQVSVYDAAGRQEKQIIVIVKNQRTELNVEGLNRGIYWITATTANGEQFRSKLIVAQ